MTRFDCVLSSSEVVSTIVMEKTSSRVKKRLPRKTTKGKNLFCKNQFC
jgi:hypothetical protein